MDLKERLAIIEEKMKDVEPRQNIIKLGEKITNRIGLKAKTTDPEYWGLDMLLSDEMADLLLKLDVRKHYTIPEMSKKTGEDEAYLEKMMEEASLIGIIEYNWENPQREKQYMLPLFVPGSAEFTNMNAKQLEEHPELGVFFERMSRLPLEKVTPMVPPGGSGIGMHVIPVEKAIESENTSVDVEHISHWLKKYDGKYAASPCSCRMSRKTYDEGCGDDANDWCIAVGDMADYVVETQKGGRYIEYDEVLEILQKAEDNGFVHQITNIDGENKIFAICNCNVDVCYGLRTSMLFNTPNMSRSAYVARVDPTKCVACGRCVEFCPSGAVKLGQKLHTKNGPIKYPLSELPDATQWGPEKWDENYRDTVRINTYETGTAPCKVTCPAHIAVQGYLELAKQGRFTEALALIKKNNPLPAVCGRICNKVCEDYCTRGVLDSPVSIDEVKKFIAQRDLHADTRYVPPIVQPSTRERFEQKIAIVGAGPAGLSCAFFLAEKGYKPTIFEKNERAGGMLTYGVPAYKLDREIVQSEIDIIKEMGVEIKTGVEVGKDITLDELREQGYQAFYLAIGCQGSRKANIPGEDAEGVYHAANFLHLINTETKPQIHGKMIVVGGGNVAIDAARSALRVGAESSEMFCLEKREEMPASMQEILEAEMEDVTINCGWGPKQIIVEDGKVKGVEFKRCISVFDAEGKFSPVYDVEDTKIVEADYVCLSIGQAVEWGNLLDGTNVELFRNQFAIADELTFQTGEPDIFVGGDVVTGPNFAINAIAAGKEGAVSLHRFVQPKTSLTIGRNKQQYAMLDKENIEINGYDHAGRQEPEFKKERLKQLDFVDREGIFTEEQIKIETHRCLGCGSSVVDVHKCIGCGICTTKCAFDAIHLYRELPEASKMRKAEDKIKGVLPYALKRAVKIKLNRGKKIPTEHTLEEQAIQKRK